MPGPYGVSLFGDDEDWEYDVDWDALDPGPDLEYGLDDYVRGLDPEDELEQEIEDSLREYGNDASQ